MGYFSDDKKMYVPLSIDTVEARRSNYFFSNKKMFYAFVAFIPIFALLTPLIQAGAGIFPISLVSTVYLVLYVYFLRFVVFEERRLKKMLRELDDNRISEVDHFWGLDKVGTGEDDNGMAYYSYKGAARGITSGLVVLLERGSTVGVPVGHYREYRRVKERFFRALHMNNLYGTVIEMQREPELQESLVEYADLIKGIENENHRRLLRLNLSINSIYTMEKEQRYVEYVVVKQDGFNQNFRRMLETILEDVFGNSNYIQEARILTKSEVDGFFKNYLMIDTLDSNNVRKSVDVKPFEDFALVHRLLDEKGREVPIHLLDELDLDNFGGRSIDREIEDQERREELREERRKRELERELQRLNRSRNRELITQEEYIKKKGEIEDRFSKEKYGEVDDSDTNRDRREDKRRRQERERQGDVRVKEYDLNEDDKETYITGDETVEKLVKKEKGSIIQRYLKRGGKGE